MRLTCPNCAARYEIADDLVPAEGRDVECSNCGQVWFQPSQQAAQDAPFDPQARPALNRQLNESMLSVLREEAARELEARAAERRANTPANQTDLPPESTDSPANPKAGDNAPLTYDTQTDWPATTITSDLHTHVPARPALPAMAEDPPIVLPDAQVMAATLTPLAPTGPVAAPPPSAVTEPAAHAPVPIQPAQTSPSRKSYRRGFSLSVLVAAALVLAYIAAPHVAGNGPVGQRIMEWRAAADHGRNWLHDRAVAIYGNGLGE